MAQLRELLDRLGSAGAIRNAELAVEAQRDEDRLVAALAERLGGTLTTAA